MAREGGGGLPERRLEAPVHRIRMSGEGVHREAGCRVEPRVHCLRVAGQSGERLHERGVEAFVQRLRMLGEGADGVMRCRLQSLAHLV